MVAADGSCGRVELDLGRKEKTDADSSEISQAEGLRRGRDKEKARAYWAGQPWMS